MGGEVAKGAKRRWTEIAPEDAVSISLPHPDIEGPLTMEGDECPWPWEPQQLVGVPMGQYHCGYCGEMCVAGMEHTDYRGFDEEYAKDVEEEKRLHPERFEPGWFQPSPDPNDPWALPF